MDNLIPSKPTWSVNELLTSYPKPTLSDAALQHMHVLSALIPPEEGSPEYVKLKAEMEEMIILVEAVRLSKSAGKEPAPLHSQRQDLHTVTQRDKDEEKVVVPVAEVVGRDLMKHAAKTKDDLYIVESDRQRN